jgi:LmbE family N-acetylglucosaminyl deacetylase
MPMYKRVLAVGAHADDVELGCGASLSRLRREGSEIRVVAFSRAEQSLPDGSPKDTLELEYRRAMLHLGLKDRSLTMGTVPVRNFPEHRQDILQTLVDLNRDFAPDLVFTMNSNDRHQDHEVVHAETMRACKATTVLGYELPWNQRVSVTNYFFSLLPEDIDLKVAMLLEYRSQAELKRSYTTAGYVRAAAAFRGYQSGNPLAEAFEVLTMNNRIA